MPLLDRVFQRLIGRGDDADIDADGLLADAFELALQHRAADLQRSPMLEISSEKTDPQWRPRAALSCSQRP